MWQFHSNFDEIIWIHRVFQHRPWIWIPSISFISFLLYHTSVLPETKMLNFELSTIFLSLCRMQEDRNEKVARYTIAERIIYRLWCKIFVLIPLGRWRDDVWLNKIFQELFEVRPWPLNHYYRNYNRRNKGGQANAGYVTNILKLWIFDINHTKNLINCLR